jgi:hypothetical protein
MLHKHLLTAGWACEYQDDFDYLRVHIRYLRRRLESNPDQLQLIMTQSGMGYLLEYPEDQSYLPFRDLFSTMPTGALLGYENRRKLLRFFHGFFMVLLCVSMSFSLIVLYNGLNDITLW